MLHTKKLLALPDPGPPPPGPSRPLPTALITLAIEKLVVYNVLSAAANQVGYNMHAVELVLTAT